VTAAQRKSLCNVTGQVHVWLSLHTEHPKCPNDYRIWRTFYSGNDQARSGASQPDNVLDLSVSAVAAIGLDPHLFGLARFAEPTPCRSIAALAICELFN
jgi:hypothetical protein